MFSFLRENFRWIAGGFLLTYFSSIGQTFFIAGSIAEWQEKFGLSHGEFGGLYLIATLASALTLSFLGRIVDHAPEHRIILATMPALAGAALLAALAPSVVMLTLALYLLRLFGQGMLTHIALTATGKWFAAQRGRAVSVVVLGHQGGEASLPLLFTAISIGVGWQMGWIMAAAALLFIALPICAWAYHVPRAPQGKAAAQAATARNWTAKEAARDPVFWVLLTGVLAPPFIGTTIFFHQDYLTDLRTWPPGLFAQGLAAMAATTVLVALINGMLIDRFGAKSILPFFLIPLACASFAIGSATDPGVFVLSLMVLGVSYGTSSTLFGALWPEIYGGAHLGAIRSITMPAMVLASAAGPGVTGLLIDKGLAFPTHLLGMGVYCVIITGLMAMASIVLKRRDEQSGRQE